MGTIGRSPDSSDAMLRSLITLVCGPDIPNVRLERITAAANAHFGEIANSVFGLCQAYNQQISLESDALRKSGALTKSSSSCSPLVRLILIFLQDGLRADEIPRTQRHHREGVLAALRS